MYILIIAAGFIFGTLLRSAKLNRYDVISGMAVLEDYTVAKAIAVAIGAGAILIAVETTLGLASYHIKPIMLTGIAVGGIVFGAGMAILGYCPGTLPISLGEGSLDALTGILGGMAGGWIYTVLFPFFQSVAGPDLGSISINSLTGQNNILFFLTVIIISSAFILAAFWLNKLDGQVNMAWLYAGLGLAVLNPVLNLTAVSDRLVGASGLYPFLADLLTGTTDNAYYEKIKDPGVWEFQFLGGAFLSGLIFSLIKKEFKLVLIHDRWAKYKGNSVAKRIFWAFTGGLILIIGARLAGGCTSGHVLSGGMQLAISSLMFCVFVFAGLLITGKYFYKS